MTVFFLFSALTVKSDFLAFFLLQWRGTSLAIGFSLYAIDDDSVSDNSELMGILSLFFTHSSIFLSVIRLMDSTRCCASAAYLYTFDQSGS